MNWTIFFENSFWINLGISIGIFLFFLVLRGLFTKYIFNLFLKLSKKTPSEILNHVFLSFEKPFQWFFIIAGIYGAANFFPYFNEHNNFFTNLISASYIVLFAWGIYNLTAETSVIFNKIKVRYHLGIDDVLIPFISKTLRLIIIAIAFSMVADRFGYSVSTFVAGLGLGGVAIAFAAKDALSQLLGGLIIIIEKPFTLGDWILTPEVEGTVEEISFRSTRIRTFSQAVVTMPNATIANGPITNWSKMGKRQINFTLRVSQETTPGQLRQVVAEIKDLVSKHPGVHPETIFVKFDQFKDNGYDIFLYFFTNTTVWAEFLEIKEDINFKILEILDRAGVSVAVQSRKVYVEAENGPSEKSF